MVLVLFFALGEMFYAHDFGGGLRPALQRAIAVGRPRAFVATVRSLADASGEPT